MKFPLVFDEHGDVSLYWSLEDAERSIESIDVRNGEYVAYDANGRCLLLDAQGSRNVQISIDESVAVKLDKLTAALIRYVGARARYDGLDQLSASELVRLIETKRLTN
jgi:hypothetical protein